MLLSLFPIVTWSALFWDYPCKFWDGHHFKVVLDRVLAFCLICCSFVGVSDHFLPTLRPQIQDVAKQMQENNPVMFEALRQQASQLQQDVGITEQQQQQEGAEDKNPEEENQQAQ